MSSMDPAPQADVSMVPGRQVKQTFWYGQLVVGVTRQERRGSRRQEEQHHWYCPATITKDLTMALVTP